MEATPGGCAQNIFLKGVAFSKGVERFLEQDLEPSKKTMNSNTEAKWVTPTTETLFKTFPTIWNLIVSRNSKMGQVKFVEDSL